MFVIMAKAALGWFSSKVFIAPFQSVSPHTRSKMLQDWTSDMGRVSFSLEGQCDPSLVNAGFRGETIKGSGDFFQRTVRHAGRFAQGTASGGGLLWSNASRSFDRKTQPFAGPRLSWIA